MMFGMPIALGKTVLERQELRSDYRKCIKTGPCGIGQKSLYLGSFLTDCMYYVPYEDVSRVFKRVAMSKGGFSGKGVFGSVSYLVVLMTDGREHQCLFKNEELVDSFLEEVRRTNPEIPTISESVEKRMEAEKEREKSRFIPSLSEEAERAVSELQRARSFLEKRPSIPASLSQTARQKRAMEISKDGYRYVARTIFIMAAAALLFGLYAFFRQKGYAIYILMFGFAFLFYSMASQVLPTGRLNRSEIERQWKESFNESRYFVSGYPGGFPVPAQYAHPAVLDRMTRVIREGRAETVETSFEVMKEDLRSINADVTVSQAEYKEIAAIKPMFLIMKYE